MMTTIFKYGLSILAIALVAGCGVQDGPLLLGALAKRPTFSFKNVLSSGISGHHQFIDGPGGGLAIDPTGGLMFGFYSDGNVETGEKTESGHTDGAVLKWNASGQLVAKRNLPSIGSTQVYGLTVSDLAVAADGSYFVTGAASKDLTKDQPAPATGDSDAYLVKYSATGEKLWARQYGWPATHSQGNRLALDAAGRVYLVGTAAFDVVNDRASSNGGFFVMAFDANGGRQWVRQSPRLDGPSQGHGVAVSARGDVYVVGSSTRNFETGVDYVASSVGFVAKYDRSGALVWIRSKGETLNESYVNNGVAFDDRSESIFVVGMTNRHWAGGAATGVYDYFVAKYRDEGAKGTFESSYQFGVAGATSAAQSIAIDSQRNLVVAGYTTGYVGLGGGGMIGSRDAFTARFSSSLAPLWVNHFGVPGFGTTAVAVVIDGRDNVLVGGYSTGNPVTGSGKAGGGTEAFVRGYTRDGQNL